MTDSSFVVSIDVGGTKVAGAIVDSQFRLLERRELPTRSGPEGLADPGLVQTLTLVGQLRDVAQARGWPLAAGAVGVPEYVTPDGSLTSRECLAWDEQPMTSLRAAIAIPWTVESDVRCAAIAEAQLGAGRRYPSVLYVTASTGISSTLVINGQPWAGARGEAIGLGALSASQVPESMTVEEYASGLGIVRRYEAITGRTDIDARGVAAQASHDTQAADILTSAGRCLGVAVAAAVEVLDPAVVVIGGGLWCGSATYREHALAAYRSRRARRPDTSPVVTSELKADVGVLGAALFAQ